MNIYAILENDRVGLLFIADDNKVRLHGSDDEINEALCEKY